jgi:hypothetical protein
LDGGAGRSQAKGARGRDEIAFAVSLRLASLIRIMSVPLNNDEPYVRRLHSCPVAEESIVSSRAGHRSNSAHGISQRLPLAAGPAH